MHDIENIENITPNLKISIFQKFQCARLMHLFITAQWENATFLFIHKSLLVGQKTTIANGSTLSNKKHRYLIPYVCNERIFGGLQYYPRGRTIQLFTS